MEYENMQYNTDPVRWCHVGGCCNKASLTWEGIDVCAECHPRLYARYDG